MKTSKDRLCDEAIRLYIQNGYDNVRIIDICSALGVTKGSFFHHFQNKYDVLHYWLVRYQHHMIGEERQTEDLWEYLKCYAEEITSVGEDLLYHLIVARSLNSDDILKGTTEEIDAAVDFTCRLIRRDQDAGIITKDFSPEILCKTYNEAFTGLIMEWHMRKGSFDFVERLHTVYKIIFRTETKGVCNEKS